MYTREILPPRASPIEDGMPLYGTWNRAFEKVDLLEIRKPFKYPLPRWIKDNRIKEWECFSVQNDSFFLETLFCNVKLYRMVQVFLYDRENDEKFSFRKIFPGKGKQLPNNLSNSFVDNHSTNIYFRIHSWLDADTVKLDVNIEASRGKPSLTVHLAYNLSSQDVTPLVVSLGLAERRNMYAYKALAPVSGDMVFSGRHIVLKQEDCSGFFVDGKGFFPYRMQTTICSASGFDDENRRIGFHIAENLTRETYKNNENALWVNGRMTPLPPVLITMQNATDSKWVIQDVEGMVDLTFTPKEQNHGAAELIFTNAAYDTPVGLYNGVLLTADGEQINIKNLFGMGEKLYLRV
ncbi:MAG: DUF2804 domain-containing protein [Treponema sp.]|jgi:hypothetical protein|nr:DUF2804 domain-containing protein [Treponema sp.]